MQSLLSLITATVLKLYKSYDQLLPAQIHVVQWDPTSVTGTITTPNIFHSFQPLSPDLHSDIAVV